MGWREVLTWKERIPGGKAQGHEPGDFDPHQISKGREVEREHSADPGIKTEITMDHLMEHPRYYDFLEDAEDKMKLDLK